MIQAGAGELHCVEMNPNMFRQAQLVRSVTEQLEGRTLTTPPPEQVVTRYHPPRELLEQLEEAILTVRVNHGRAVGELSLNPRETSLREKLKALMVTEYQVFPLLFEPDELLTMDGHPDMEAALPGCAKSWRRRWSSRTTKGTASCAGPPARTARDPIHFCAPSTNCQAKESPLRLRGRTEVPVLSR